MNISFKNKNQTIEAYEDLICLIQTAAWKPTPETKPNYFIGHENNSIQTTRLSYHTDLKIVLSTSSIWIQKPALNQ